MNSRQQQEKFQCPCCGYKTLPESSTGTYIICEVCYWEDDPVQRADPDYEGGANRVSLRQGQKNFQKFGACEQSLINKVRRPMIDERPDDEWRFLDQDPASPGKS